MASLSELAVALGGSLRLRPYVFAFLGIYLVAAVAAWGARRTLLFTALAVGLAFAAEWSSTRVGIPFGLYHYTGATRGQELYLGNVPFFDPLSFSFLAFASLGLARAILPRAPGGGERPPALLAAASGGLMAWLDLVIDPLAVRGDRWFLGRIFFYPKPGPYFGVPLGNFVGWALLGATIVGVWIALEGRVGGRPPAWATRLPGGRYHAVGLYYAVLAFNLIVTALCAEPALLLAGAALHVPLAALVVSCLARGS